MKITMKTIDAINLCTGLETIAIDNTRKMPGNIAWNICRTYKSIIPIKRDFEEMQQNKVAGMIKEGKAEQLADNNGTIQIPKEYMSEYIEYMNSIALSDIDIDIYKISQPRCR